MNVNEKPGLDEFLAQIEQLFERERVETLARETKFVQRRSKLTGHIFLITYTFAMSLYANPTLEQLSSLLDQVLERFHEDISREGLHQRINDSAVAFFEAMLAQAIHISLPSGSTLKLVAQFVEVIVVDSTSFQVPANLAHLFGGSGGSASTAAIKIRFGYDLKSGRFFYRIQGGKTPDNRHGNGIVEEVRPGALRLSDLGFFNLQGFWELAQKGAYYLSRMKTGVNLYHRTDDGDFLLWDLVQFVTHLSQGRHELVVYLRYESTFLKTRLIVEPVPDKVVRQRIRRMKRQCQRKGRSFPPDFKILASVNTYITNAPKTHLPSQWCRLLYSIRWQIELIFKLWKSNFALECVAGIRKERVLCTLYAKLLCIFVTSKLVFWVRNEVWNTRKRELSEFRAVKVLQTYLADVSQALMVSPDRVTAVLRKAIKAMTHCLKSTQRTRRYPLDLLDEAFS
jgi:hypothetical protein